MRKTLSIVVALLILGAGAYGYYRYSRNPEAPTITTARVTRGDLAETVGATGALQAVTTVQLGTQVSGTIQELNADFNSLVRKGQVLARLDPSLIQSQIEQARANLIRAQADLERLRVALDDARTKLNRARELSEKKLIAQTELEAADVAVRSAEAQLRSQEAGVTQSQASLLQQNQVNLQHTVIESPIDGLVISRNVDVGQTVADTRLSQSEQRPIAQQQPQQQQPAQPVAQAHRRQGTQSQPEPKVPQTQRQELTGAAQTDGAGSGRGGGSGWRESSAERMASMTPEEREPFVERIGARGFMPPTEAHADAAGRGDQRPRQRNQMPSARPAQTAGSSATTFDALFGPLAPTQTFGQVWLKVDGKLQRVRLRLGTSDGQQIELLQVIDGNVEEGTEVVTNVLTGAVRQTPAAPAGNAFPGWDHSGGSAAAGAGAVEASVWWLRSGIHI